MGSTTKGRADGYNLPDTKIDCECSICGYVTEQGKSSNGINWNTLRDQCQTHAMGEHDSNRFTVNGMVNKSWQEAMVAFQNGMNEWTTENDIFEKIPSFHLTRV